ncbi:PREDICTED: MADS-box protein SOC1-like isoform X2 [Ipomoea nil]|uniref:MADS-box protein SOC1-like isoform X2 n=1 Tax=Ipomoea nil TaxID=35883 RepID=UPI000901283A|nr:PREDICTED: MADS-box protein SOC1-like isoform X2 [Ipomoea nil]
MVRGKTQMRRIENATSRQVTFSKRRNGLLKKAFELSVLCDVEIALIIFSPRGKLHEFASSSSQEIIEKYRKHVMNNRAENPSSVEGQPIEQLQHEIEVMKHKIDCLEASKRRLLGLRLGSSTFEEVEMIEQHVQRSVNIIRARKMKIFKDSIEQLEEKGKVLTAENAMLWEKYKGLEPHKVSKEEDDSHDSTLYVNGGDEKSDVETELFIGLPEVQIPVNDLLSQVIRVSTTYQ